MLGYRGNWDVAIINTSLYWYVVESTGDCRVIFFSSISAGFLQSPAALDCRRRMLK